MKNSRYLMQLSLSLFVSSMTVFAFAAGSSGDGGSAGGGGGKKEPTFNQIVKNIGDWIQSGNADTISLPPDVTLAQFKAEMSGVIANYNISFTDKKIMVNGYEKTCHSFVDKKKVNQIECNNTQFGDDTLENANAIYRNVFHELAGLACRDVQGQLVCLEQNKNEKSDYRISDQVSANLRFQEVMRLPILPASSHLKEISLVGETQSKATGEKVPVRILIQNLNAGPSATQGAIVVTLSLNYGGGVSSLNTGAILNLDTNSLTSRTILNLENGQQAALNLDCHFSNRFQMIQCDHVTDTAGVVAQTLAHLDSAAQDPRPSLIGTRAVQKKYHAYRTKLDSVTGKAVKTSETEADGKLSSAIDLIVNYPAQTFAQHILELFFFSNEKNVYATVVPYADDEDVSVEIPIRNVVWDISGNTLRGVDSIPISSGSPANVSLDCVNFKSTANFTSKEPFTCTYSSTANGAVIDFTSIP